jgi:mono/diheme cytochrome c family protein
MLKTSFVVVVVFALICAGIAAAADVKPAIKQVPIAPTSAASGAQMYQSYCVVCHGPDGSGGGPAAAAMKTPPPDLTVLAKKNGGKFPSSKVYVAIGGDFAIGAHGSPKMPVWGRVFRESKGGADSMLRVSNLTAYVETLQSK